MISLTFVIFILVAAMTAVGIAFRNRWLTVSVPAALLGAVSYFMAGIYAAQLKGAGRFYSVPFGGYAVSNDWNLFASTLFWVGIWAVVLHLVVPRWGREKPEGKGRAGRWKAALSRTALAMAPLALTPALGWLISAGYLNFGGGCKDIVMIFPWIAWSVLYLVIFIAFTIKKAPLGRTLAWSAGGATVIMAVVFLVILAGSLAGVA